MVTLRLYFVYIPPREEGVSLKTTYTLEIVYVSELYSLSSQSGFRGEGVGQRGRGTGNGGMGEREGKVLDCGKGRQSLNKRPTIRR